MRLSEAISSASRASTNQSNIASCKEICLVEKVNKKFSTTLLNQLTSAFTLLPDQTQPKLEIGDQNGSCM